MKNPDYSIFDATEESMAMKVLRRAINVGEDDHLPMSTTTAAIFVIDTIHRGSPQKPAASRPVVATYEKRGALFERETAALKYIGGESNGDGAVLSTIQSEKINEILSAIGNFRDIIRRIKDAESHDVQTARLYKSLVTAMFTIRNLSVGWLENYRREYWNNPITQACRGVSNTNCAVLYHLDQKTLNDKGWERFHDSVENLYDKCHDVMLTHRFL